MNSYRLNDIAHKLMSNGINNRKNSTYLITFSWGSDNMKTIEIKIKGMHCPSCEMLIKDVLEETEGVEKVTVSQKDELAKVTFNEEKVQLDYLKSLIKQEGYKVE